MLCLKKFGGQSYGNFKSGIKLKNCFRDFVARSLYKLAYYSPSNKNQVLFQCDHLNTELSRGIYGLSFITKNWKLKIQNIDIH